ncbi:DUF4085 family protein [Paenibacillus barcinonensis]|uniref:DUF4085 family protein n=1 Tax=Paenibacillus barcinonensis TaxID=198119 RepID=A0A2V4WK46_PAEBA|nr:DUF4085 family protein [Paenibacillus barcinonensis]PYE47836.1 uncharacterized protein DUF4085 [Paenibacillus barcinonensis]QKS59066.1 DUF4085 family protein [Paenibacillus barcinonensis]
MKYLTKEWYETCQQTGLHFGMRVHKGATLLDEALFQRLYKRKEKEHVKLQRDVYNTDPRFMLEHDGQVMTRVDKAFSGEEVTEEDQLVYHMPPEERAHIETLIAEYDARPAFDEKQCKDEYAEAMEWNFKYQAERLPSEIFRKIADIRVFALGYCTREVMQQLKKKSAEYTKEMEVVLQEYRDAMVKQDIPADVHLKLQFHDCKVTDLLTGDELVLRFDTRGGFTEINKLTLTDAEMLKQEGKIVGSYWLYDELYRIDNGYELHVLLNGEPMSELIVRCTDIVAEIE